VPGEQASQLAAPHAEALGKFFDRRSLLVESALLDDKPYRALDGCTASDPCVGKRRGLGTAPQAWAEASRFGRRCGRKKLNVSRPCWANGADRSTIDTRGPDSGEKSTVIAGITCKARAITFRKVHRHHGATVPCRGDSPERRQGMESRPGEQRSNALAIFSREKAPR
jgi:hypothetical protein